MKLQSNHKTKLFIISCLLPIKILISEDTLKPLSAKSPCLLSYVSSLGQVRGQAGEKLITVAKGSTHHCRPTSPAIS